MGIEIAVLLAVAIGGVAGFLIGRSSGGNDARLKKEYEEQLRSTRQELDEYRRQVTDHFKGTANLMREMTENYKSVYQHLAKGAQSLTDGAAPMLAENMTARLGKSLEADDTGDSSSSKPVDMSAEDVVDSDAAETDKSRDESVEDRANSARQAGL